MLDPLNTQKSFNRWTQLGMGAFEPMIQLSRLNLEMAERMAEVQFEAGRDYVEMQTRAAERLSNMRDSSDMSTSQEGFAADFADTVGGHLEKLRELGMETQQAYAEWFQDAMGKAAATSDETLREAADMTRQATQEATEDTAKKSHQSSTKSKQASGSKKS